MFEKTKEVITNIFRDSNLSNNILEIRPLGGGNINHSYAVRSENTVFFIKLNSHVPEDYFVKEAEGLIMLKASNVVDVPEIVRFGSSNDVKFLILEYIEEGKKDPNFWSNLGSQLAKLHTIVNSSFGFKNNNYIGSLPQENNYKDDWNSFFRSHRIEPQLYRLSQKTDITSIRKLIDKFYGKLEVLFPPGLPSLLHGDLWSGNIITNKNGFPLLIDPSVYYGHREMEISFTKLFGGFHEDFYKSYNEVYPLETGFEERIKFYNIYPLLVHANLFGGGYLNTVVSILKSIE